MDFTAQGRQLQPGSSARSMSQQQPQPTNYVKQKLRLDAFSFSAACASAMACFLDLKLEGRVVLSLLDSAGWQGSGFTG